MRRLVALILAALLVSTLAADVIAPAPTQAARSGMISGRLVAAPQTTIVTLAQPATLLLQAGARTVLVTVTIRTQIVDHNGRPLGLGDLHNNNMLQVSGTFNGVSVVATRIRDVSVYVTTTIRVQGTLAAAPDPATAPPSGVLCLINAAVTGVTAQAVPAQAACPAGQLPIFLNGGTRVVRRFGGTSSLSELSAGDTLLTTGSLVSGQYTATTVQDISIQEGYTHLDGTIIAINPLNQTPTTITLNNLTALAGQNAPFPNPLPAQISLPVSGLTKITIGKSTQLAATGIGSLQVGQVVSTLGVFNRVSGQFLSTFSIRVLKAAPVPTLQLKGTLAAAPNPVTTPPSGVLCLSNVVITGVTSQAVPFQAALCPSGQLPVYLNAGTSMLRGGGELSSLAELRAGDLLQVTGSLVNNLFTATTVRDMTIA